MWKGEENDDFRRTVDHGTKEMIAEEIIKRRESKLKRPKKMAVLAKTDAELRDGDSHHLFHHPVFLPDVHVAIHRPPWTHSAAQRCDASLSETS